MFILALDEGYLQIEGDEYKGYRVIDYPGGVDYTLKINGKKKIVKIAPIGQIIIEIYNEWLEYDLSHGGTVKQSLQDHGDMIRSSEFRRNFFFPENVGSKSPDYEIWVNKSAEELLQSGIEYPAIFNYLNFIPTSYIKLMGQIVPVFSVDDIHDLEEYDMREIITQGKGGSIRLCEDCGKAFFGKTTAKRCLECRDEGNKRQIRENKNKKPFRGVLDQIVDTANKRLSAKRFSGQEGLDYQNNYVGGLQTYIKRKKKEIPESEMIHFADNLKIVDQKYYEIFKYIEDSKKAEIKKAWRKDRYTIWQDDDPERWLRSWFEKAGLAWE